MIHGLSLAHLGVSFSAPYHHKSFYIITAGNGKYFVTMWLKRKREGVFQLPGQYELLCCMYVSLCCVDVLFLVCLLPFINMHIFLWDCGVLRFHGFLFRSPDFSAEGLWNQGCRIKKSIAFQAKKMYQQQRHSSSKEPTYSVSESLCLLLFKPANVL